MVVFITIAVVKEVRKLQSSSLPNSGGLPSLVSHGRTLNPGPRRKWSRRRHPKSRRPRGADKISRRHWAWFCDNERTTTGRHEMTSWRNRVARERNTVLREPPVPFVGMQHCQCLATERRHRLWVHRLPGCCRCRVRLHRRSHVGEPGHCARNWCVAWSAIHRSSHTHGRSDKREHEHDEQQAPRRPMRFFAFHG